MITLRNKLYESLLDDEDDLISRSDDNIVKDMADKIFKGYKYNIENDGKVSFFGPLTSSSIATKDIVEDIFSGKYLNDFKRFTSLTISKPDFISNVFTKPIHINKIDYFDIVTSSIKGLKIGDVIIDEITEFAVEISDQNTTEWVNLFKNTKIKTLYIKPLYSKGFDMRLVPPISGINVDKLIINNELVPGYELGFFNHIDWGKIDEYINYVKSNNIVKYIYITDPVEKSRTKFHDRYIRVKKIK